MMKKRKALMLVMMGSTLLATACSRQSTPSMMNTSLPQVTAETALQQVPLKHAGQGYINKLADEYARYGSDTLRLSLAYDPADKSYSAVEAFKDLGRIKSGLQQLGVRNIAAETVKAEGAEPTLLVSYDAVRAAAPAGCRNMPGLDDGLTTAEIADYRFGCSVDTMLARQIYRPADLQGQDAMDDGDGRRAANTLEHYRQVTVQEADGRLERMGRGDMQE